MLSLASLALLRLLHGQAWLHMSLCCSRSITPATASLYVTMCILQCITAPRVPHGYMMHVTDTGIARKQASGRHLKGSWKSSCMVAHWNFLRRASKTVMSIFGP